jgi:hypothetical protein
MKTTAATRSKLISNPEFATNYSKLCLLINVGRVNTTLAFYPQMKTALRTYHPIPSLQTEEISRKEMSDAPRLKAMLKMAFLDWEVNNAPATLKAIAEKKNDPALKRGPPTTIIEAIFLVFQEPQVSLSRLIFLSPKIIDPLLRLRILCLCSGYLKGISRKVSTYGTSSSLQSELNPFCFPSFLHHQTDMP